MSVAPPVVLAERLARRQGGRWALRGVELRVEAGESVMICGPNGAGKTTLVRVLGTALAPSAGSLVLFGGAPEDARPRVALLSHADHHYDDLSARENLRLHARLGAGAVARVAEVLDEVGLSGRADEPVRVFSAGMRKRLAFARVLLKDAPLVLLDEPYAGLDPAGASFVDGLLRRWRAEARTVLVSTHQLARVAPVTERALVLRAGSIAWTGPSDAAAAALQALAAEAA